MLKLASRGKPIGTPVRCPACGHPNLAIDIWCERCGRPLDLKPTAVTKSGPIPRPPATEAPPAADPVDFCPNCGAPSFVVQRYCPLCGSSMWTSPRPQPATPASPHPRPHGRFRMPRVKLPALTIPTLAMPRVSMAAPRLPRLPGTLGVVVAVVAVLVLLLIAPLAYSRLVASHPVVARTTAGSPFPSTAGSTSSPQAAAIPGVEAKTGLHFSTKCASNAACLALVSQTVGKDAAAVVFSTASSGGRQCAGYVFQQGASWHFLDAVCGLPSQLSPLVGHDAAVHVAKSCANLRSAPGLSAAVVGCVDDGTVVHVEGGPTYGDGRLWWQLKNGWMAHDFLVSP